MAGAFVTLLVFLSGRFVLLPFGVLVLSSPQRLLTACDAQTRFLDRLLLSQRVMMLFWSWLGRWCKFGDASYCLWSICLSFDVAVGSGPT